MQNLNDKQLIQITMLASQILKHFEAQELINLLQIRDGINNSAVVQKAVKDLYQKGDLKRVIVTIANMKHKTTETIDRSHALAGALCMAGYTEWGEHLYKRVIALNKQVFGDNHLKVALAMGDLAAAYQLQGKFDIALEIGQQAVDILKKQTLPLQDNRHLIRLLRNHSETWRHLNQAQQSFNTLAEALKISERVFGEIDAETISLLREAGIALHNGSDFANGLSALERAFLGNYFKFGLSDAQTIKSLEDLLKVAQSAASKTGDNSFQTHYRHYFDDYQKLQQL